MLRVMRAYTNYVLHIGSRISKHLQTKVPKGTFELIHLIKTSLFSRFDLYSNRRHANRGTSPLEHLYSRDSSVQGAQIWSSIEGTPLFRGEVALFLGSESRV